jgi:hypothetical protein
MAHGKKTGGRRKGTPNKRKTSFRTALQAYCEQLGVDPHRFMADMLANNETVTYGMDLEGTPIVGPAVKMELKLNAAKELAQYLEPKLKAMEVEHSMNPDRPIRITIRRG